MRITLTKLLQMARDRQRIAMISCYDAISARLVEMAGVDIILVGDSLGMLVQGHDSTLPVSMEEQLYHTRCVVRGCANPFILGDMPFGSYQAGPQEAFANAARLMAAGAQMIKIEGGAVMASTVAFLAERGIPVCGHVGLTPQSVNALGGFRVQGKTDDSAARLLDDVKRLEDAGMSMIVVEAVPAALGAQITRAVSMPTIGIGAGVECAGQILLLHDLIDMVPGKKARFVKNFMSGAGSILQAVEGFVREVKDGSFPGPEHSY